MHRYAKAQIPAAAPPWALQRCIVSMLRGALPEQEFEPAAIDAALRWYECGGYLHDVWQRDGRRASLRPVWAAAVARAHRRTLIDNLAALAEFRSLGGYLAREQIPFILLKGAAYLVDLYDDPGVRPLTDIDILLRHRDVSRVAQHLNRAGLSGSVGELYPEDRRFEMWHPRDAACRFEFHWWLGLPQRLRVDQEKIWSRSRPGRLEGITCRLLDPEDAFLYHVGHLADHYYGPTLKWVIDLRAMLRRWPIDPGRLASRAAAWRVRIALYLALRHLAKIFPEDAHDRLESALAPGPLRSRLLRAILSSAPAELMAIAADSTGRFLVRPLLLDSLLDSTRLSVRVLSRPLSLLRRRLAGGPPRPPWDQLS